jgi:hypothetical protein
VAVGLVRDLMAKAVDISAQLGAAHLLHAWEQTALGAPVKAVARSAFATKLRDIIGR